MKVYEFYKVLSKASNEWWRKWYYLQVISTEFLIQAAKKIPNFEDRKMAM